jgi:hypothetical protein
MNRSKIKRTSSIISKMVLKIREKKFILFFQLNDVLALSKVHVLSRKKKYLYNQFSTA